MFDLAETLSCTVEELGQRMGSRELSEWMARLAYKPWGPYRRDLLNALVCYASIAPWQKGAKVTDWIPDFGGKKDLDGEQLLLALKSLGGKIRGHDSQDGNQLGLERPASGGRA